MNRNIFSLIAQLLLASLTIAASTGDHNSGQLKAFDTKTDDLYNVVFNEKQDPEATEARDTLETLQAVNLQISTDEPVQILTSYVSKKLGLEGLVEARGEKDLGAIINQQVSGLEKSCKLVRVKFNENSKTIESHEMGQSWLEWPELCRNMNFLAWYQEQVISTLKRDVYALESDLWGSADERQILAEWRDLKRDLYSPSAKLIDIDQIVSKLERLDQIQSDGSLGKFNVLASDLEEKLIELQLISPEQCTGGFPGKFKLELSKHARSPVLLAYIDHFRRIQVQNCGPKFADIVESALGDVYSISDLKKLKQVVSLYEGDLGSEKASLQPLVAKAVVRYAQNGAIDRSAAEAKLAEIGKICSRVRSKLSPLIGLFDEISKSQTDEDAAGWLKGTKICRNMLFISLPPKE